MTKHKPKGKATDAEAGRGRRSKAEDPDEEVLEEEEPADSEFPAVIEAHVPHEPDPREVDNMTERIFRSVLSRYGWERHGSRLEHVGGAQSRNRQR